MTENDHYSFTKKLYKPSITAALARHRMDSSSTSSEVAVDGPLIRIYKDGRIERLIGTELVSPGLDPETNVESKDVVYSQETGQSLRLYVPKSVVNSALKLPLALYFHGGAFCVETAFSPTYHNYLNSLVKTANVVAVSVDYRRAPEHPIPAAYRDSWDALKWVASHRGGKGPELWLNTYVDFNRVYLAGDSAGANIAHHTAIRIGKQNHNSADGVINLVGIVLVHPYFWGKEPIGDEIKDPVVRGKIDWIWRLACSTPSGSDDPWINPIDNNQNLASLGCGKVLVCVAEKDILKHRGLYYCEKLKKSGWRGEIELMESPGEIHIFHLFNPSCEKAVIMQKKVAAFMNHRDRSRL